MMFYSTNDKSHRVDARAAVMAGLAPDGGLYMPETIPRLSPAFFETLHERTLQEIGFTVAHEFLGEVVPDESLRRIVDDALNFEIPLVPLHHSITPSLFVLELFHGPTLAFKDVGARFMARLMGYFIQGEDRELTILVATSGDTGSAVASGFAGVPGIRVVILYPSGKVSEIQEAQLTSMGGNVTALKVDGVFDDCQRLVKQAFVDADLRQCLWLTSANSINIARLIPQTFYYFWALAQLARFKSDRTVNVPVVFSVPSGNFGNLTAGLMAKRMGLPVERFIAATNVNDVVPEYLDSAVFRPRPSVPTISNAMDVGNPSNFVRMLELYDHNVEAMRRDIVGIRVSEEETRRTIRDVYQRTGYTLDPHGAVACAALIGLPPSQGGTKGGCRDAIFLATAHPAKFAQVVREQTGADPVIPPRLASCLTLPKHAFPIPNTFEAFKSFLLTT